MKNYLLLVFSVLLFSCGGNEKQAHFSNLTVKIDTVMVDSKGEILNLIGDLMFSDLSPDYKSLYYIHPMTLNLEIVDLDKLEFVKRIQYDEEGPNGVGRFPMQFQTLSEDQIFIGSFSNKGVFDLNGVKTKNIDLKLEELGGDKVLSGYNERALLVNPNDQNKLFALLNEWAEKPSLFGLVDTQNKTFQNFLIPEFDYLTEFKMVFSDGGNPRAVLGDWLELVKSKNKLILSNKIGSDLYVYDLETESFTHHLAKPLVLPSKKSVKIPSVVETMEEFSIYNRNLGEDINFSPPHWDENKQLYYRFVHYNRNQEIDGKLTSDGAEVHLLLMDKDFTVVSETLMENYSKAPSRHFVKDGMLWVFENINDEMGFIRLKIR
ncbi:protein of unknown function [Belliella buryatensis]|uniref:DUF4221 domain-containing protein n=1 Tax=Belliella buryatensis TaxID=1500549 RepID=A0A239BU56_9BACT|nr:DUF4221 family protein [Belliella buryatensis]SNS11575.1 protein of unknown function [Belliella buryatensis]